MDPQEKEEFADGLNSMIDMVPATQLAGAFEEFGWLDMLEEAPKEAVEVTFPIVGKHLINLPLLDDVLVQAAGLEPDSATAVVYPALSQVQPTSTATVIGEQITLQVRGVVVARDTRPETVVIPVLLDGVPALVSGTWDQEWPTEGTGIDNSGGWAALEAEWTVSAKEILSQNDDSWLNFRATAHRALAFYMIAVGVQMLKLGQEHVTTREQFGQTISAFQVVRHKLADVRIWQETATLAAEAAMDSQDYMTATLAKIFAGRFLASARLNCQQLLGGMGMTTEHPFHNYMRRALVLEKLFGSAENLRTELGDQLKQAPSMPRLVSI